MLIRCAVSMLLLTAAACAEGPANPWTADQVVQPAALARKIESGKGPAIFMVGPHILYNGNHIRRAVFAGPAGKPEGIELLHQQTASLPKDAEIVLYCGCCPMERCPNIRPAFAALSKQGFTNVKILEIPTNLPTDWTEKGYPVQKGATPKAN